MCERLDSVLPFGWSLKTLSDIAIDENGIVDGPFGSNLKVSDYVDDAENGVPVLTTKNLSGDYSRGTLRYVTKDKYDTLKRSTVFPGDILVAKIGSIGKCGIYPLTQKKALIPANLLKITLKEEYDRKFVFYYIQSGQFQKLIKSISTATAQPAFNVTKFRKLPVIIPPLEEQKRIVARIEELFSELDAAVATLERTKEQLSIYRQAVLKEAFEGLSNTTNVVLGDLILEKPRNGYSPKGVEYETPFRNLTLTSTTGGVFKEGYFKYVDLDIDNKSYLWVKHNDILIQRANTLEYVGTAVVYPGEDNRYVYPDLMMKCHLKEGINPYFIVHQLQSYKTRLYYQKNATGTAGSMPKINQKTVSNTPLIITDINTQDKIVSEIDSRLSVCDKIEETVTTALQEAEAMRQSILKQAFAGEL